MLRRLVYLLLLGLSVGQLNAQSKKYTQLFHEDYDNKRLHFGFQFGFSTGRYFVGAASNPFVVDSPGKFGFQVGGTVNYALNEHFEIKSGLNVALYARRIEWANATEKRTRESTWLEIPVLMKFRSIRRKNHRAYLVGGTKFSWESNKRASTDLMGKQIDLSLEYGFGIERFNRYFKFTPEIRFSNGLVNMYNPTSSVPFNPRLMTNTITLILNFE